MVNVTGLVGEAGERQFVGVAAALVIETLGVGAHEVHADALVDHERQRGAETGNDQLVFALGLEVAEVGLVNTLVRSRVEVPADIAAGSEGALVNDVTGGGVNEFEAFVGNGEFAERADEITDRGLLRPSRNVALLVDVNRRAVTQGVGLRVEVHRGRPEAAVGVLDHDLLAGRNGTREFQEEAIADAQVAVVERRVKRTALETDGFHGDGLAIDGDGELPRGGGVQVAVAIDEVPAVHGGVGGGFAIDADQFEDVGRKDVESAVPDLGVAQLGAVHRADRGHRLDVVRRSGGESRGGLRHTEGAEKSDETRAGRYG